VVVNWRTPELTTRAARSLIADGVPRERVVVVDDGSGDGSARKLLKDLPGSVVVALPENRGFGRAANAGVRELPARLAYLLVNSDAFVHARGSVSRLLCALDDPGVGAAAPRLLDDDLRLAPSVYPLPTPLPSAIRAAGLSRFVPDSLAPRLGAHWSHSHSREIQYAIGAVLLVRAATWNQLGGFDERSLMYAEDQDLFWRLRRLGWRSRFVSDAEFVHIGGASASRQWDTAERAMRVAAAEATVVRRHLPGPSARVTNGLMAAGASARALRWSAVGDGSRAREQLAGVRGYLRQS
jgi:GT2 family glycosyltransferase